MTKVKSRLDPIEGRPVTEEAIFKASKEIAVKFIEVGRLTPAGFEQAFGRIYNTVRQTVLAAREKGDD